ncbi:dienelactone hydrolase family protein [Ideonella livida]|uniref:Xaa-Pro dipeptidyl-peptidase-like domain-containing protein n=1 Tax=Ideonella livida TaxID=2707176 RepID=A0A7C9PF29_9BURK|nr:CocE/NonD family hydrolase [Ideonella livida]NDY90235.1 hypothetical protein [Ideonella livida]
MTDPAVPTHHAAPRGWAIACTQAGRARAWRAPSAMRRVVAVLIAIAGGLPPAAQAQTEAPAAAAATPTAASRRPPPLDATLGEAVLRVPEEGPDAPHLEVSVFRPPGPGPFPVLLFNHGRAKGDARQQPRSRPVLVAREFVSRGWVVVAPMRQGFAGSGGREPIGGCDLVANGLGQARSVHRTLRWLEGQPWADLDRLVVLGQSHGGLVTLAYGTQPHPGTRLLVNVAGGLRQERCPGWEENLLRAFARFGAEARLPSLWFYGDNDALFPPALWREAHLRHQTAGGLATLVAFGTFRDDAHALLGSPEGRPLWAPPLMARLQALGLPTTVVHPQADPQDVPLPPASGHAPLDDPLALPFHQPRLQQAYRDWLLKPSPRAFAIDPQGQRFGWSSRGERPRQRALTNCQQTQPRPCQLYAVDDAVVWTPTPAAAPPAAPSATSPSASATARP